MFDCSSCKASNCPNEIASTHADDERGVCCSVATIYMYREMRYIAIKPLYRETRYITKRDISRLIFIHFAAIFTIHVYENQHS